MGGLNTTIPELCCGSILTSNDPAEQSATKAGQGKLIRGDITAHFTIYLGTYNSCVPKHYLGDLTILSPTNATSLDLAYHTYSRGGPIVGMASRSMATFGELKKQDTTAFSS